MATALPAYIARQLEQHPPSGTGSGRHDAMRSLSLQMTGESIAPSEQFSILRAWCPDRDKTDREIRDLIEGAAAKNPSPATGNAAPRTQYSPERRPRDESSKPRPYIPPTTRHALPSELEDTTPIEFLERLFEPDEYICITWPGPDGKPRRDEIRTLTEWQSIYRTNESAFSDPNGVWFVINPLIDGEKRGNARISKYKRTLLEGDAPREPEEEKQRKKEEMYTFGVSCGLPISASYDSGDRSIHHLVEVDADNEQEFKVRVEEVYAFARNLPGLDPGRKASAQLSRLPGAFRGENIQALLSWHVGASNYAEWQKTQLPESQYLKSLLGAICTSSELIVKKIKPKPPIIGDWFLEGDIGFIYAARGVGKTWLAYDMAKSISSNLPFGPWPVNGDARNVLYVDGEVSAADLQKRTLALDAGNSKLALLNHEMLFEASNYTVDISDKVWQEAITVACEQREIKVIILDNLSCLAPDIDENEGVAWSSNLLRWTLGFRNRGMSVVFVQHAGRNGQMRGHSRREDPANWMINLTANTAQLEAIGAKFTTHFKKNRNAPKTPTDQEFFYQPQGNKTTLTVEPRSNYDVFLDMVQNSGMDIQAEIAQEMQVTRQYVGELATRALNEGLITKTPGGKLKWSSANYE